MNHFSHISTSTKLIILNFGNLTPIYSVIQHDFELLVQCNFIEEAL